MGSLRGMPAQQQEQVMDLQMTPAERAKAVAEGRVQLSDVEEAKLFAEAEEIEVGSDPNNQHIVIVGAGLVGSLCAVLLLRKGFKVSIFERYPDIRSIPTTGKSINLSVTSRGLRAIGAMGGNLYEDILGLTTIIKGRIIHMPESEGGKVLFQRYGKDDSECNYSVSRSELNKFLIDVAAKEGADYHWNSLLSQTSDFGGSEMVGCTLHFTQENTRKRVRCSCPVIACDGAGSRVRKALKKSGLTSCSEEILPRGYKEVLFPNPGPNGFGAKGGEGNEKCDGRYGLHIWPRGEHMLMALSNRDGSFTGTIYMDNEGETESFAAMDDSQEGKKRCEEFCKKYYSEAVPLVGGLESMVRQITTNPTGILGTVKTDKWAIQGKVMLIGDACHAMVPFFGQGCNCGFEDTLWLSRFLDKYICEDGRVSSAKCIPENFAACFAALEQERKPSAEAICDMALENFVEMRDKTGDVKFQAMKKVENLLENKFPTKFRSRYAMVCYGGDGNVSYANAKMLGVIQMEILHALCDGISTSGSLQDQVDFTKAEQLIDSRLVPEQNALSIDISTVKH